MRYLTLIITIFVLAIVTACDEVITTLDTEKPEVQLAEDFETSVFNDSTTISGSIEDASAIAKLEYKLNGSEWRDISDSLNESTFSFEVTGFQKGKNNVRLLITDSSDDKTDFKIELSYKIDETKPSLEVSGPSTSKTANIVVKGKVDDENGIQSLSYQPNSDEASDITKLVKDSTFELNISLKKGSNMLKFIATDKAANQTVKTLVVNVLEEDKDPPQISISNGDERSVSSNTVSIKGELGDRSEITLFTYQLNQDKKQNALPSLIGTNFNLSIHSLTEGKNSVTLEASDKEGNQSKKVITINYVEPSPDYPNIEGLWGDQKAVSDECTDTYAISLTFDVVAQDGSVTGNGRISNPYGEFISTGKFKGSITEDNELDGELNLAGNNLKGIAQLTVQLQGESLAGNLFIAGKGNCGGSVNLEFNLEKGTDLPVIADDSFEANDSQEQAKLLELNKDYSLVMKNSNLDWFQFELKEPTLVNVNFKSQNEHYRLNLIGSDYFLDLSEEGELGISYRALSSGVYFLEIGNRNIKPHDYMLKVETKVLPDRANEPNNNAEAATAIEINVKQDVYLSASEEDWYTFTLDEGMIVSTSFESAVDNFPFNWFILNNALNNVSSEYLEAGKYYLKVLADSATEMNYSFKVNAATLPDKALEPNNSREEATNVVGNFQKSLYLIPDEQDWFKIVLSENSKVGINISQDVFPKQIHLINSEGTQFEVSRELYLKKGTYYARVLDRYEGKSGYYDLSINIQAIIDVYEPNDTQEEAILIGTDFSDNIHTFHSNIAGGDQDWFKLVIEESQFLTLSAGKINERHSNSQIDAYLRDDKGNNLLELYSDRTYTRLVEPGVYYLVFLAGGSYNEVNIPVTISGSPLPDAEFEPNNSFNSAKKISLPFDERLFVSQSDADWLKFTLLEDRVVVFDLSKDDATGFAAGFQLYKSNGQTADSPVAGQGRTAYKLSSGTHYVRFGGTSSKYSIFKLLITEQQEPDLAYEPNDLRADAYPIDLGFSEDNLLAVQGEADWFTFTLDEPTEVNFSINATSREYIRIQLIDDKNYGLLISSGNRILNAGIYDFNIRSSPNKAVFYTLSVSKVD